MKNASMATAENMAGGGWEGDSPRGTLISHSLAASCSLAAICTLQTLGPIRKNDGSCTVKDICGNAFSIVP